MYIEFQLYEIIRIQIAYFWYLSQFLMIILAAKEKKNDFNVE